MPLLAIGPAIAGIVHNFQGGEIEDVPPLAMHAAAITIPLGLVSLALALFVV